ncbi:MAG TPA: chloride channel protein [Spirochaetia bacterium]|nr:chloride channel protein [Spirochaetia bacterium]
MRMPRGADLKLIVEDLRRLPENTRGILQSVLYAAAAGGAAVLFLWLTNLVFRETIIRLSGLPPLTFVIGSLCVITLTATVSGLLMTRISPETAGSGVPQLKAAYWKDLGFVRLRAVIVKFVAGVLTLGGGTSLGREGPSVFVGGGAASALAAALGVPKTDRRLPAATGAAAALAAAFNTPLAAITFVLEEMLNNEFSSRVLGGVVFAAVTGALIVQALLGPQPAFSLPSVPSVTWLMYAILPVVAAAASLIGVAFQTLTLGLRLRVRDRSRLPAWLRPMGGALITWALGCGVFLASGHTGVFGLGYNDLSLALTNNLTWEIAGLLVVAKFAATVASYGWGGSGGIFSPTLFLGGLTGFFLAGVAGIWIPLTPSDRIVLAAVGMSACFNAVVRAPLTALLIVFEMTHQFSMVPALMFCSLVSQAIGRLGGHHNFYDALLLQDGHELIRIKPPRDLKSWQSLAVSEIAKARPLVLPDVQPRTLQDVLSRYPYERFPVVSEGRIQGVLRRSEIEAALAGRRPPRVDPAVFCRPETSVREVGALLIRSATGMVLVSAADDDVPVALVTLHDLLRVQASFSD